MNKAVIKAQAISFAHTFVATFLSAFATVILTIPKETLASPEVWTTSFWSGVLVAVVRVGVKLISEKYIVKQ